MARPMSLTIEQTPAPQAHPHKADHAVPAKAVIRCHAATQEVVDVSIRPVRDGGAVMIAPRGGVVLSPANVREMHEFLGSMLARTQDGR